MQLRAVRWLEARSFDSEVSRFGPAFDRVFGALGAPEFTA